MTTNDLFDLSLEELLNLPITSAGRHPEKVSDIPASVTIITRDDIKSYGYTSIIEVLEHMPGLYNINNYLFTPANFGTRGLWNPRKQNASFAVLVNGVSQVRADERSHPFSKITVPVEAIDRIEFVRGPISVIYGNGASFGMINIITNESVKNTAVYAEGSDNTRRKTFTSGYTAGDLRVNLDLSDYSTDGLNNQFLEMSGGIQALGQRMFIPSDNYSTEDLLEHENQYFHLSFSFKGFYVDLARNKSDIEYYMLAPALTDGTIRKVKSTTSQLGYKFKPLNNLNVDIKSTFDNFDSDEYFEGLLPGVTAVRFTHFKARAYELTTDYQMTEDTNIVSGLYYQKMYDYRNFLDAPLINLPNEFQFISARRDKSFFTQVTHRPSDNLTVYLGYRFERNPEFQISRSFDDPIFHTVDRGDFTNETSRIAVVYDFQDHHILKAMYGEASRISDDGLDAEVIETYELMHTFYNDKWIVNTSLFYNNLDNLVVTTGGVGGSFSDQSIGEISNFGLEINANTNINASLSAEAGLTYQSPRNEVNSSIDVAYSPKAVFHGKMKYKTGRSTYSLTSRYVSSMESLYDFENSTRHGEKIDGYFVTDLNFRIQRSIKDVFFNVRITNVFNQEVRYPNNPENNGNTAFGNAMNLGTIGSGRQFMATMGWEF